MPPYIYIITLFTCCNHYDFLYGSRAELVKICYNRYKKGGQGMKYRKITAVLLLLLLLLTGTAFAAKPTITADRTYFDVSSGLYILKGNVYIEVKNRVITAGEARVNLATLEVWGSGGVTVKQDDIYFTGGDVYVYGTKNRAKIDGGVQFSRTGLAITADTVDFSWDNRIAQFNGNVNVTQGYNAWTSDSISYNVDSDRFL
jgi:lipopolysaccharide assembly outer membrane protein LptD (OstA)